MRQLAALQQVPTSRTKINNMQYDMSLTIMSWCADKLPSMDSEALDQIFYAHNLREELEQYHARMVWVRTSKAQSDPSK